MNFNITILLMIKNLHIAILLAVTVLTQSFGQPVKAQRQDNLQQQKMAFFNEKLQLTPAESAKFWPVYNDYQNRRDKITRDRTTLMQYYVSNKVNMTEKEASDMVQKYVLFQQEETKLLESFTAKFREFLPAKKVMQVYLVELDFKKWLLENLRQNKVQATPRN
jgi:hypothetical protein